MNDFQIVKMQPYFVQKFSEGIAKPKPDRDTSGIWRQTKHVKFGFWPTKLRWKTSLRNRSQNRLELRFLGFILRV